MHRRHSFEMNEMMIFFEDANFTKAIDFTEGSSKTNLGHNTGLEINNEIQSQFCDRIRKFSRNFANRRAALCCQRFSETKYEPTILVG